MAPYRWILVAVLAILVITYRTLGDIVHGGLLIAVGITIVCAIAWLSFSTDRDHEPGDNSVWDAIPAWQYEGRHIESGGLARAEQEQAIAEIQAAAEALDEEHTMENNEDT